MVFSDQAFLFLFLPFALAAGPLFLRFQRPALILAPSLIFYYWSAGAGLLLLVASIAVNFFGGLAIERWRRKDVLVLVVALNLAVLISFKYAGFLVDSVGDFGSSGLHDFAKGIVLPIGISFFTFQGVSYVVDVWRRDVEAETDFLTFAAYKAFFPQLIAGPIVRYREVRDDFHRPQISPELLAGGVARFMLGLLKKVLVADQVAIIADAAFALPPGEQGFATAWLGAIAYSLQIYFDFSGYSDMAIGLAMMFGITFRENFNHPYAAATLTEFWRRWHISLSTWFRDYLYIPLGGNRRGRGRTYLNLAIVFLATGLWHGAAWTFVLWGAYHGAFLILERLILPPDRPPPRGLRFAYFLPVAIVGWVLFRSESPAVFVSHLGAMLSPWRGDDGPLPLSLDEALAPLPVSMLVLGGVAALLQGSTPPLGPALAAWNSPAGAWARFATVAAASLVSAVLALPQQFSPFLYFRF